MSDLFEEMGDDMDAIARMARRADRCLSVDETERAQRIVEDIKVTAEAWESEE